MKKNKLQRHLTTNHPGCVDKPVESFKHKLQPIASQKSVLTAFTEVNKSAVYSSFVASYQIAKQKKPHSIGEKLLMPAIKDVVKIMIGERESKIVDSVSLSATTVKRRNLDMSHDVLEQIIGQVNTSSFYAIQLHESTDIAGLPQLSLFIRYISNGEVLEKLLFCKALQLHTRGKDIFKIIDGFFHDNSISLDKCAGILPMEQHHVLA